MALPVVRTVRTVRTVRAVRPVFFTDRTWAPVDVATTDEAYTLTVELPGVKRDEIAVELIDDDTLAVRGGRVDIRRTVPADVDRDGVAASLADGVLTVTLPRLAAPAPRRIEIAAA